VLEELLLLVLEELALSFGLLLPRLGALADVRELAQRAVSEGEGEEVVAAEEVDGLAVPGEDGVGLDVAGVGQAPDREGAPVDVPEVALVGDDAGAVVGGDVAVGEEDAERVGGLVGEALGLAAAGAAGASGAAGLAAGRSGAGALAAGAFAAGAGAGASAGLAG